MWAWRKHTEYALTFSTPKRRPPQKKLARIRTLKPEIWQSHDLSRLSILGRLIFVVLITQSDDYGKQHTDAHHLARVFLHDPSLTPEIQTQLNQMQRLGMVSQYRDDQKQSCVALVNFSQQQRVDHPRDSRVQNPPNPRESSREFANKRESSLSRARGNRTVPEGIVPEGSIPPTASGGVLAILPLDPIAGVFQAWVNSTGRSDRTILDGKRRGFIERALKTYPREDVLDAIHGWSYSPHHRGENDRGVKYNDLELILRDSKHIEMFRDLARGNQRPAIPIRKASVSQALREQAAALRAEELAQ